MRRVQIEVAKQHHDGRMTCTTTRKILVEQYDTIEEAVQALGSDKVLKHVNFMQELEARAAVRKTI